jgi:DNA-binding SARP family transcriptional activator
MRPLYHLELVGPPRVLDATVETLPLGSGKPMSLLVHLALRPGGATRQELAESFWPDSRRSLHSLRQALSRLRKTFPDDPFRSGERLQVDPALLGHDLTLLAELAEADDAPRLTALVRGPVAQGLDFDHSPALAEWFMDRRAEVSEELAAAVKRVALALREEDRDDEAEALIDPLVRAELATGPLRAAVFGRLKSVPEPGVALRGDAILGDYRHRLSEGSPLRVVLVRGAPPAPDGTEGHGFEGQSSKDQGSGKGDVTGAHVTVVRPDGEAVRIGVAGSAGMTNGKRERSLLAGLLSALRGLPGGRGVSGQTVEFHESLDRGEDPIEDPAEAARVLGDALDAVLYEAPLELELALHTLPLRVVEMLARALADGEHRGLLVVAWSPDLADLSGPAASALGAVSRSVTRLDLLTEVAFPASGGSGTPAEEEAHPQEGATGAGWIEGRGLMVTAAVLAVVALLFLRWPEGGPGAGAGPEADRPVSPPPTEPHVVCTVRYGVGHLYYHDAVTGLVERVSPQGTRGCSFLGRWAPEQGVLVIALSPPQAPTEPASLFLFRRPDNLRANWEIQAVVPVTALPESGSPTSPVPHGLLPLSTPADDGTSEIALLDLSDATVRPVGRRIPLFIDAPVWHPSGRWLFWQTAEDGFTQVARMAWPDGAPEPLVVADTDADVLAVRGDTLLVALGRIGDAEDGTLELGWVLMDEPDRFIALTDNDWNDHEARVSPDGRYLCWTSEELGHFRSDIAVLDRTTGETRVVRLPGRQSMCKWSAEGHGLYFHDHQDTGIRVLYQAEPGVDEQPYVVAEDGSQDILVTALPSEG